MEKPRLLAGVCACLVTVGFSSTAQSLTLSTTYLDHYLLVGQIESKALDSSLLEFGSVNNLSMGGIGVSGPGVSPTLGTFYDGNIAITNSNGTVTTSNIDIYADRGIECTGSFDDCTDEGGNLSNTRYDDAAGGTGLRTISNGDGVNGGVDLAGLISDITGAKELGDITMFDQSISTTGGTIDSNVMGSNDYLVNLVSGMNLIDFSGVNGSDVKLEDANLIFQGPSDATAVVIVPDTSNFLVSKGNLVIGDGGIGLNNVLIASLKDDSNAHFSFSNSIVNGVAFWDLGMGGGEVNFSNVAGCTQVVGDKLNFNDVNLSRCGFSATVIPVPAAVWLFGSGLIGLIGIARRKKTS
jgi:hypothetical protein